MIALLRRLQEERGLSYVFISHDLGVVRTCAIRLACYNMAGLSDLGLTEDIFERPRSDYHTRPAGRDPTLPRQDRGLKERNSAGLRLCVWIPRTTSSGREHDACAALRRRDLISLISSRRPLPRPSSRWLMRIVVSGGWTMSTSGMSLWPTTEMSSGTRSPAACNAS